MKTEQRSNQPAAAGSLDPDVRCQLRKDLHKFVDEIVSHCECPSMWPLSQQDQITFVRKVIYQAQKIRNTEEYLRESVMLTAAELAKAS